MTHNGPLPFWMVSVFGLHRANAVVEVEFLPVSAGAGVLAHSLALRIVRQSSIDYVGFAEASMTDNQTWRMAHIETDARVLFCRERDGRLGDVFLLDGSRVRASADPPLELETPHRMEQVHWMGT